MQTTEGVIVIEQLKTIRAGIENAFIVGGQSGIDKALTALTQLEAMVGAQQPVAWAVYWGLPPTRQNSVHFEKESAQAVANQIKSATEVRPLFATPPAQQPQYEAGDMASAAAQGFRDGVASVTQQEQEQEPVGAVLVDRESREGVMFYSPDMIPDPATIKDRFELVTVFATPVAQQPQARPDFNDEWTGYLKDGETPFERFMRERKDLDALTKLYQRALEENESLKAQQPQAKPDIHEAQGQIEFLDKKNNALSAAIRKVMARLADLLDEDQFKEIEEIVSFAGVQPQAEVVPNPAVAAIEYVLSHPTESPIEFLNCWMHGDFRAIRNEWEDVPEAVFVGADPTVSTASQQDEAVPPGYVLVPVEPTEEMLLSARDWSAAKYGKPIGDDAAKGCWGTMINAAIAQQKGQP